MGFFGGVNEKEIMDDRISPIVQVHAPVADFWALRISEVVILNVLLGLILYLHKDEGAPPLSQLTFVSMVLSGLCAAYLRMWPYFVLGVRLYHRWGAGWEIFLPCLFPCNFFIPVVYHLATNGENFSALSVVTHLVLPMANLMLCFCPSVLSWSGRLTILDVTQAMGSFLVFMYATLWYYQLTQRSWPYRVNGRGAPDLFTVEGNTAVAMSGIILLLLAVAYHTIASFCVRVHLGERPTHDDDHPGQIGTM